MHWASLWFSEPPLASLYIHLFITKYNKVKAKYDFLNIFYWLRGRYLACTRPIKVVYRILEMYSRIEYICICICLYRDRERVRERDRWYSLFKPQEGKKMKQRDTKGRNFQGSLWMIQWWECHLRPLPTLHFCSLNVWFLPEFYCPITNVFHLS